MRHYYGYNSDGTLVSCWMAQNGHPPEFDLHNKASDNPRVQQAFESHAKRHKDFVGFVAFDCGCLPGQERQCECGFPKYAGSYVKDGVLTAKADASFNLDGMPQGSMVRGQQISRDPGSKIQLVVVCSALADGEVIKLAAGPGPALHAGFPSQVPLIMTNGVSESTTIVAPAQGLVGSLCVMHKRVRSGSLWVRGFAS